MRLRINSKVKTLLVVLNAKIKIYVSESCEYKNFKIFSFKLFVYFILPFLSCQVSLQAA